MYFLCICKFCFIFKFTMYWTLFCMYALFLNFHQCHNKRGKFFLFKNNVTFCGITSGFQKFIFKFLIQKSQSIFKIAPFKWSVIITKVILSEKKTLLFLAWMCSLMYQSIYIYIYIQQLHVPVPVFMAVYGLGLYHKQTWHHLRTKIENIF